MTLTIHYEYIYEFNNIFISITPSRSLGLGWHLTLRNCEIYYLSADKFDPVTTDAIFIRVNIYSGPGMGGLMFNSYIIYLEVPKCEILISWILKIFISWSLYR